MRKSVAIVYETSEDDFFLLSNFLEQQGFRVERVKDYKDIVSKALSLQPQLIFYAGEPGDSYGCQLLKNAPETSRIPIFLLAPKTERQVWQRSGVYADEFLSKPVDLVELERRISRLLKSSSPPEQIARRRSTSNLDSASNFQAQSRPIEPPEKQPSAFQVTTTAYEQTAGAETAHPAPEPAPAAQPEAPASADPANALYEQARTFMLDCLQNAAKGERIDFHRAEELIDEIQEALLRENTLVRLVLDQRPPYSLSSHSVNACILSCIISMSSDEPVKSVGLLGQAALFHDIGSIHLPYGLLFKVGRFTPEELEQLHRRPEYSRELILSQEPAFKSLGQIVYQVCEREDGSGYPLALRGPEITREAKIIGLADYYEAVIHSRPHREGLSGFDKLNELVARETPLFPVDLVITLIRSISLYSVNEYVLLNSGEIARVVELTDNPVRPVAEVFIDNAGHRLPDPRRVDLTKESGKVISRPLSAREVMTHFSQ